MTGDEAPAAPRHDFRKTVARYAIEDTYRKLTTARNAGCDTERAYLFYTESATALESADYRKAFIFARLAKDALATAVEEAGLEPDELWLEELQDVHVPSLTAFALSHSPSGNTDHSSPSAQPAAVGEPTTDPVGTAAAVELEPIQPLQPLDPAMVGSDPDPEVVTLEPVDENEDDEAPDAAAAAQASVATEMVTATETAEAGPGSPAQPAPPEPAGGPSEPGPAPSEPGQTAIARSRSSPSPAAAALDPVQKIAIEGALTLAEHALEGIREFELYNAPAEENYYLAEQEYYNGDFKAALKHARLCLEAATTAREEHISKEAKRLLPRAQMKYKQVVHYGLASESMGELLDKSQRALEEHCYSDAYEMAEELRQECVDAIGEYLKSRASRAIQDAKALHKRAARFEVAPDAAAEYIQKAREAYRSTEWENAEGLARIATKYCQRATANLPITKAETAIREAERTLESAHEYREDTMEDELLIERARIEFDVENYDEATEFAVRARRGLKRKVAIALRRSAQKVLDSARSRIGQLAELGVDEHRCITLHAEAQERFDNGEYEAAEAVATSSRKLARNLILELLAKKALSSITAVKRRIEVIAIHGGDAVTRLLVEPKTLIGEAERCFKNAIYDQAESYAMDAAGLLDTLPADTGQRTSNTDAADDGAPGQVADPAMAEADESIAEPPTGTATEHNRVGDGRAEDDADATDVDPDT